MKILDLLVRLEDALLEHGNIEIRTVADEFPHGETDDVAVMVLDADDVDPVRLLIRCEFRP